MADVTGPISTMPGAGHSVPEGETCDRHPERLAVKRIQGETDSFGSEMHDLCQECVDEQVAWSKSPEAIAARAEARKGTCDWCKEPAEDLRDQRDFEEGTCGRIYRVCGACVKKQDAAIRAELAEDDYGDYDDCDD